MDLTLWQSNLSLRFFLKATKESFALVPILIAECMIRTRILETCIIITCFSMEQEMLMC